MGTGALAVGTKARRVTQSWTSVPGAQTRLAWIYGRNWESHFVGVWPTGRSVFDYC